jgi:hypothetical protein
VLITTFHRTFSYVNSNKLARYRSDSIKFGLFGFIRRVETTVNAAYRQGTKTDKELKEIVPFLNLWIIYATGLSWVVPPCGFSDGKLCRVLLLYHRKSNFVKMSYHHVSPSQPTTTTTNQGIILQENMLKIQ